MQDCPRFEAVFHKRRNACRTIFPVFAKKDSWRHQSSSLPVVLQHTWLYWAFVSYSSCSCVQKFEWILITPRMENIVLFKGELQRQNKSISSERRFKILQNETEIIKIGQAVLEIFNFKYWDLDNFTRKNDRKTESVVFLYKFCKSWRKIVCVTSEMINAQFNNNQSRILPSVELIRTWNLMDK